MIYSAFFREMNIHLKVMLKQNGKDCTAVAICDLFITLSEAVTFVARIRWQTCFQLLRKQRKIPLDRTTNHYTAFWRGRGGDFIAERCKDTVLRKVQ
jgi:hypothetical protein